MKITDLILKRLFLTREIPIPENYKEDLIIYLEREEIYFCFAGEVHNQILLAFRKCLNTYENQEVDTSVNIGESEHIDICCKINYIFDTREITVEIRRIKSIKTH